MKYTIHSDDTWFLGALTKEDAEEELECKLTTKQWKDIREEGVEAFSENIHEIATEMLLEVSSNLGI